LEAGGDSGSANVTVFTGVLGLDKGVGAISGGGVGAGESPVFIGLIYETIVLEDPTPGFGAIGPSLGLLAGVGVVIGLGTDGLGTTDFGGLTETGAEGGGKVWDLRFGMELGVGFEGTAGGDAAVGSKVLDLRNGTGFG